jgi:DnaJ-class molecular chaperone
MTKNYYEILGVEKDATEKEITKQYRKLAALWHPDRNLNNKEEAETKFKEISEAYGILSDSEKRKLYDEYGEEGLKQQGNHMDPNEILKHMFGHHEDNDVPDLKCELELTLEQIYNGCTVKKEVERISLCNLCHGYGTKDGGSIGKCKSCNGNGKKMAMMGPGMFMQMECNVCNGTGKLVDKNNECKKCHGKQFRKEFIEIQVDVPKGVYDEYPIIIEDEGHAASVDDAYKMGKKRSNIVFFVREKQHDIFKRFLVKEKGKIDMADLGIELNIKFGESIVGFNKKIQHLDGEEFEINFSESTRHGDIFVLKGMGMPKIEENNEKGDLFVSLNVEHPNLLLLSESEMKDIAKILGVKIQEKNNQTEIISFDKYKKEIEIENNSENMRQKYNRRKHGERYQGAPDCTQQ